MEQKMSTQGQLDSHERECAVRYESVQEKLKALDKRLWRLEAMIMTSTLLVITLAVTILTSV
mgnify:CR=1 FL=1